MILTEHTMTTGALLVVAAGALASPGTTNAMVVQTSHTPPPAWARQIIWTGGGVALEDFANEATEQNQGSQVMEVRRRTGLTWEKLGELFGVDRRAVHFWASGRSMNSRNREKLGRILAILQRLPEDSAAVRGWLQTPDANGALPFDLLREGKYNEIIAPQTVAKIPFQRSVVAPEVLRARAPRPPEELVNALHESVHHETTKLRAAIPLKKRT